MIRTDGSRPGASRPWAAMLARLPWFFRLTHSKLGEPQGHDKTLTWTGAPVLGYEPLTPIRGAPPCDESTWHWSWPCSFHAVQRHWRKRTRLRGPPIRRRTRPSASPPPARELPRIRRPAKIRPAPPPRLRQGLLPGW